MYKFIHLFFIISLLFVTSHILPAQKEDYQWALGSWGCSTCYYRFFYDFNTDPPSIVVRDDSLSTSYHAASISDKNGNILAYSNALRILNAEGKIIDNSEDLNPNGHQSPFDKSYPVPKTSFFLRKPENDSILYYIHLDFGEHPNPTNTYRYIGKDLRLTTINLAANNGLGKVIDKNKILISGIFTVPLAVRHANGRDWWVFISDADENRHYRFLLTPQGFTGPWVQGIGSKPNSIGIGATLGNNFSPSGRYYIDFNVYTGFSIFDFDRCTGLLANERRLNYNNMPFPQVTYGEGGGVEFSPDDHYLYVSVTKNRIFPGVPGPYYVQPYMLQYPLDAQDLQFSGDTINYIPDTLTADNFLQQEKFLNTSYGPDGRIYVVYKGGGFCTIQYPKARGGACDFRYNAPFFDNSVTWGLPNMPNYRLGPLDGNNCDTLNIDNMPVANFRIDDTLGHMGRLFYDLSYGEPVNWLWSFGDGDFSQDTSPIHQYAQTGVYNVCLIVSNSNGTDTLCRQVNISVSGVRTKEANAFSVNIFPNPVNSVLRVRPNGVFKGQAYLRLFSVTGKIVQEITFDAATPLSEVDVQNLKAGLFFYEVVYEGKLKCTGKVLKID